MKKSLLILLFALGVSYWGLGLTTGDIALIAVNTDASKTISFVALVDIPANTSISFTDNAWNASTSSWRTGEGTIVWSHTALVIKGTVITLSVNASPFSSTIGTVTTNTNFNLSASGDQILSYEGTTLPTSNDASSWLYGFSTENWTWANNTNTSDIPTALTGASVAMTTSTTEVDNAYFANGTTSQTTVSVSGTKNELLILFNDGVTKYYKNDTGPLTLPAYTITVNTGGANVPPAITNITHTPSSGITSITTVSVSADVTDSDGTVAGVELHWGTASGVLGTTINMSNVGGDTYTTDTDIPAQLDGTTVYYEVYALDDDADETTSPEQSYTVTDPVTTPLPYTQTFDADLDDCLAYSVTGGTKNWIWDDKLGTDDGHAYMNGYISSSITENQEDWLILPGINLNSYTNEIMQFYTFYEYGNEDADNYLKLFYSTNYAGVGDPTAAAWTELSFIKAGNPAAWQPSYIVDLSAISGINVYIGFKYYSTTAPRSWRVDDITIFEGTQADVTFQVNMAEETVSPNGVHIAGSFNDWWSPSAIAMTDPELDQIYSVTMSLYSGIEYQFKYINGNDWISNEVVPATCVAPGTSNRFEIIGGTDYSIDPVCFGSCVNCGVLSFFDITFRVDMKNETILGGVNIAGSFNGWSNTAMTNTSGNIWEVTLSLQETSHQEYKFKNGNDGWENFDGPCLASSWGNRYINVPSANTTLNLVCFNSCDACPVANFVMINEVDADTPGTDAIEFVELFDGGVGNTDLTGLVLVLYNGSNDLSYAAYDLDGYSTDVNGYFVLGSSTVPNVDMLFLGATDQIQNGADAVALFIGSSSDFPTGTAITTVNLLDALVYDTSDGDDAGLLVLLNAGQPQINENGRPSGDILSNQRIPNGSGGMRNTYTYDQALPTPGAVNLQITSTWTGTTSTAWHTSSNWMNGIPAATSDALIPSAGITNFPVINTAANSLNLTIESGANLQIDPTGSLTVAGTLANSAGNSGLVIKSDATGTGSLIENNGVSATVERYLTEDEWHYVSAPVDDPTANVFLGMYMMEWDEPTGAFSYIIDENTVLSTDMEGFAIWTFNPGTVEFTGNLNTGSKSISATATGPALHNGYNFAGNPYPSSLDWDIDANWSRTNIDDALYIWIQQNINGGQYGAYVNGIGTFDVDNVIPPHQGFYVHCSAPTGSLGVNNGARIHSSKDIFKSGESISDVLKLRIEGNDFTDEMIIQIDQAATINFDQADAAKFRGSAAAPQLYSLSKDDLELSINSFPVQDDYMVIPVGLEVGTGAVYTLSVEDFEGFEFSSGIYLEDLKEGTFTKLEGNTTYNFTANPLDEPMRFLLHMSSELAVPEVNSGINGVNVYSYDKDVYIISESPLTGTANLFDLLGREILSKKLNGESMLKIDLNNQKGYVIVNLMTDRGMLNQKIYIR